MGVSNVTTVDGVVTDTLLDWNIAMSTPLDIGKLSVELVAKIVQERLHNHLDLIHRLRLAHVRGDERNRLLVCHDVLKTKKALWDF